MNYLARITLLLAFASCSLDCFAQSGSSTSPSLPKEASARATEAQLGEVDKLLKEGVIAYGRKKDAKPFNEVEGAVLKLVQPDYPKNAMSVRAQGVVIVRVMVNEEGKTIAAQVDSGHPLLRAASIRAARQTKLRPVIVEGKPVKVVGSIAYNFNLR